MLMLAAAAGMSYRAAMAAMVVAVVVAVVAVAQTVQALQALHQGPLEKHGVPHPHARCLMLRHSRLLQLQLPLPLALQHLERLVAAGPDVQLQLLGRSMWPAHWE